jgi:hypothetical protein
MYRSMIILLTAALFATAAEAAKMYKWVDENGVTHFSTRQPPRQNADKTQLQGGNPNQPSAKTESQDVAKIKRKDLSGANWEGCKSQLCRLVQQLDPGCETSYCSRAKTYSSGCSSAGCQTKKLAFEADVQNRLETQAKLRQQQAINANAVPAVPTTTE